ncbi:MAG: MBL fold metallo-hydrolase [Chloroflexota bacterium]
MTTKLVLLGTGTPNMEPTKFQSSLAIIVDGQSYIVDCGGGTIQRLSQARAKGLEGLEPPNLTHLFLTHLHPDHTVGLADFMIAPWVEGRKRPLKIYGPQKTDQLVNGLLAAYETGIAEHRDGDAGVNHPLLIETDAISSGVIYQDPFVTVEAFPVSHGDLEAYGLKFTTPDKTIVISGDTCPVDALLEQAQGCDILVHEVYSADAWQRKPKQWQGYHQKVHTSTIELAAIANKARPDLLVLVHQLTWDTTDAALVAELTALYDGKVVSGKDLNIFS